MKPFSNLAKIVYRRTYSRADSGTQESWSDTIERVVAGNVRGHNVPESEIKALLRYGKERKAIPAGRGLWFSGTKAHGDIGGTALVNCWFLTGDNWENFVTAQNLLMLGGGVGLSVEHRFVSKLPKVKKGVVITHKPTKDADFIIPDSREGWCELTYRVLESFFDTGRSFSYSTYCLRGAGEPIKGFGGKASGPIPLVRFVDNLSNILRGREGRHIRPIDAADLICATGEMVVSGNVRRSAIIILGDPWDKELLKAKRWDLAQLPSYRSCANFSVIADDVDDLHPLFWKTYDAGEPFGLVNRKNIQKYGRMGELKKDTAIGVNPCQPGWATVLTPNGIRKLREVDVGDTIWSGSKWTQITAKTSSGIKEVYSYTTNAGIFNGTKEHRVVSQGVKVEVDNAKMIDTCTGSVDDEPLDAQDVMDGLVIGDGGIHKASNDLVLLYVGEHDQDYLTSEISGLFKRYRPGIHPKTWEITTTVLPSELPKTYLRQIPDRFRFGNPKVVRGFLRGIFSANGSISGDRVTLKASSPFLIRQVQEMLSSVGIRSYLSFNTGRKIKFSNGEYLCKNSYDININLDKDKFNTLIGFIQHYKNNKVNDLLCKVKRRSSKVKVSYEVTEKKLLSVEEVFNITVDDDSHTYWTGGLLVSNCGEACLESFEPCNLQEIPLMNLESEEEFIDAARLLHRYGKRVTMERYGNKDIEEVIRRNRRVGTGITGCLGSKLFNPATLNRVYQCIQEENRKYSSELGIPESIRTTVVKPSGTVSKVLDQHGYEGIHAAFSRYMIQRIRFSANDPLIPILRAAGHKIEPEKRFDGTVNQGTLVVDFYVEAPPGVPVADEDWDLGSQLDVLKMAQKYWSDQAVSVTVYYKKEAIPAVKEWLRDNLQYLKTISFLCHNDHGFIQAPKEAITEEQYAKLSAKIKPIDIEQIGEGDLESQECASGVCPLK